MRSTPQTHASKSNAADTPSGIAAHLAGLIESQAGLLNELESLSPRQTALIEADAVDELVTLVEARQVIITRLVDVSAEIEPFRLRWESLLSAVPRPVRDQLATKLDGNVARAERLATTDGASRDRLIEKRDAIAQELRDIGRGSGAHDSYTDVDTSPRFQDRDA